MKWIKYCRQFESSRMMYAPEGQQTILDELVRWEGLYGDGLVGSRIIELMKTTNGSCYVSVPFDCPESYIIEDFNSCPFVIPNGDNSMHWDDMMTQLSTQLALVENTLAGRVSLLYDLGTRPEQFERYANYGGMRNVGAYWYLINGKGSKLSEIEKVYDISTIVTFVLYGDHSNANFDSDFLNQVADLLHCVIMQAMDWSGFLVWFPKRAT